MRFGSKLLLAALAAALTACAPRAPADVDQARLVAADKEPGNWMSPGRTFGEQRFSPLKKINDKNVGELGLAWFAELETMRGVEATPLVIDGVLYNISSWNKTTAYDAKTGAQLWTYDPKVPPETARLACCDIVSRGLSAWKGKIIIATLDGRLIELDAKTGKEVWNVQTLEPQWPYTVTGAPRVFDGKVLIGNAGAEIGVRGYVTAYDAETGKKLWRFYTVPGDPSRGPDGAASDSALKIATPTWNGEWWKHGGGGTAWDSIVYDPELKLIYIGVGNGSPWVRKFRSPGGGDNLFLSSIVAVKADTGEYFWHYQETPGEEWDYTATQPMILADLKIGGQDRKVLMQAPKNGFFYVLDRTNGKLISAEKFAPVDWATHIDMATGRPVEAPHARYGEKPVVISPSAAGAHNFNPMSFNPETGLVYFNVVHNAMVFSAAKTYTGSVGLGSEGYEKERTELAKKADAINEAWLTAWDPVAQKEVWRVKYHANGSGGTLSTAGGLLFQGTIDKTLAAYDPKTGKKLWEGETQSVPIAAPMTYMVDGEQYVAVNAGWGGGLAHFETLSGRGVNVASARLLVFKLGGKAKLPPLPDAPPRPRPPLSTASEPVLKKGGALYAANCAMCHGNLARGGIKDLRLMNPETHAQFNDIVLKGTRQDLGMASFGDILKKDEAEAIHQYLIQRASEDWGEMDKGEK